MFEMSSFLSLMWMALAPNSAVPQAPRLDGASSAPRLERKTYAFECDGGGRYEIALARVASGGVSLETLKAAGRPVESAEAARVRSAVARFRYVDSVSLRCSNGGGAVFLLGGREGEPPEGRVRTAINVAVSTDGTVSVSR